MIQLYSLKADGNQNLSPHFKVCEFACKDGSDVIRISKHLVELLEKIRTHFNRPVMITSGYRTVSHDKQVGGSGKGYHTRGMAADFVVPNISPAVVSLYVQSLLGNSGGLKCVCYPSDGYVHLDMRIDKWRAIKMRPDQPYETLYGDLFPAVTKGNGGQSVILVQRLLHANGFDCGPIDGICGFRTREAIQQYQTAYRLFADGICGPVTWNYLLRIAEV